MIGLIKKMICISDKVFATKTNNVVFGAVKLSLLKDFHVPCNLKDVVTKKNKPPLNIWDSKTNTVAIDEVVVG